VWHLLCFGGGIDISELGNDSSTSSRLRFESETGEDSTREESAHVERSGVSEGGAIDEKRVFSMRGTVTRAMPGLSMAGGGLTSPSGSKREDEAVVSANWRRGASGLSQRLRLLRATTSRSSFSSLSALIIPIFSFRPTRW